ncbi:ATP-grasp domain-containing protein [Nesterenkonia flava]|uniref:ATP-grasp domain-containing protein n=1 Tax=Nesterenkonia flava TaxID=469799 RepID=A0ABU1FTV7_9MICC|nr:hypothetical protein [Nesterenkonia flava]MDR5712092.1 hypothetical protein [Nesterenkonia flava]
MSSTVGIVVTDTYRPGDGDNDTAPLIAALSALDIAAEPVIWHAWEPRSDAGYDLLVLRSPWDYSEREAEFRAWLARAADAVPVLNPPALVEWNLDKLYLQDLQRLGVEVVPTQWVTSPAELAAALSSHGGDWVVLKPSVSAGALNTGLMRANSAEAEELGRQILTLGRTVMVQPEVPELSEGLEKALYFFDGEFTHAISKGALLERGGGFRGGSYQENPQLVTAAETERAFGAKVLDAVARATGQPLPLYGRIDIVTSGRWGTVLLEAELFEPALNLHRAPAAAAVLARAIARQL